MNPGRLLSHDWIGLLEAANELANGELRCALGDSDGAILNAIRSGEVPLRGRMRGELALTRIEVFDLRRASFHISLSEIDFGAPFSASRERGSFSNVQIDFTKLVEYLRENLCINDRHLFDGTPTRGAEQTLKYWFQHEVNRGARHRKEDLWAGINTGSHELYDACGNGKLSKRAYLQIWRNLAPAPWKRPGRPPDRKSQR
jgi:hypothetical protein